MKKEGHERGREKRNATRSVAIETRHRLEDVSTLTYTPESSVFASVRQFRYHGTRPESVKSRQVTLYARSRIRYTGGLARRRRVRAVRLVMHSASVAMARMCHQPGVQRYKSTLSLQPLSCCTTDARFAK